MWEFEKGKAIYLQIADRMEEWILRGEYECGELIPSVRVLAEAAGVNPNTMQRALTELESRGLVYSVTTAGRYVTEEQKLIRERREVKAKSLVMKCREELKKLGYELTEILGVCGEDD